MSNVSRIGIFWRDEEIRKDFDDALNGPAETTLLDRQNQARTCLLKLYTPFIREWLQVQGEEDRERRWNLTKDRLERRWAIHVITGGEFGKFSSNLAASCEVLNFFSGQSERHRYLLFPNIWGTVNVHINLNQTDTEIGDFIRSLRRDWRAAMERPKGRPHYPGVKGIWKEPPLAEQHLSKRKVFYGLDRRHEIQQGFNPKVDDLELWRLFATEDLGYQGIADRLGLAARRPKAAQHHEDHSRKTVSARVDPIQSFIDPLNHGQEWFTMRKAAYGKLKGKKQGGAKKGW